MSQVIEANLPARPTALGTPPLEGGDALSAREFLRRYEKMPSVRKAELIEGTVRMPSPVRYTQHAAPDTFIQGWLWAYSAKTPGTNAGANATVIFDRDNVPQPDALLRFTEGGGAHVGADGFLQGAPELIVEISASTVSIDTHAKLRMYRRNGVREYLVWRVLDGALDWWLLDGEEYIQNETNAEGMLESRVFPGLKVRPEALLAMDAAAVLAGLAE
jgi:Uma2 family endonuclease